MTEIPILQRNQELQPADRAGAADNSHLNEGALLERGRQLSLLRRLISSSEQDRRRIGRVLGNDISQLLVRLLDLLNASSQGTAIEDADLQELRKLAIQALSGVDKLAFQLYPPQLDHQGLPAAISAYAARQLQGSGIEFHSRQFGDAGHVPPEIEITLYRVAQVAIKNVCDHSAAKNALCVLEFADDCVKMRIADDGRGFDTMTAATGSTGKHPLGLLEMQERIELVGGSFRLRSTPTEGTVIRVSVPLSSRSSPV